MVGRAGRGARMRLLMSLVAGSVGGGLARYAVIAAFKRIGIAEPSFATLAVNAVGCLLIGLITGLIELRAHFSPEMRVLLITGLCGAFTTFSTFIFDAAVLVRTGHAARALLYMVGSVAVGFALFLLGGAAARAVS